MLDIDEMNSKEIQELLQTVGYGHLGCMGEGHPYVVPMHLSGAENFLILLTNRMTAQNRG